VGPLSTARVRKPSRCPRSAPDPVGPHDSLDEPDRSAVRKLREWVVRLELILSATGVPRSVPEVGIPAGERATIPFSRRTDPTPAGEVKPREGGEMPVTSPN
jgi:hypothetical protein